MRNHNNKTNQRAVTEPLQRDWCGKSLRMLSTYLPGPLQSSWWKQQKCKQSPEAWQKFGHLQMRRQFQSMNINITTTFEFPWKHSCLSRQSFALVSLRKCRVFTGLCLFLVLRAKHGGSKNNASAFYFCDDVKKKNSSDSNLRWFISSKYLEHPVNCFLTTVYIFVLQVVHCAETKVNITPLSFVDLVSSLRFRCYCETNYKQWILSLLKQ